VSERATRSRGESLTVLGFVWRALFAVALVMLTYNPSQYSYFHWLRSAISGGTFGPAHAVAGILLIGGWAFFLHATFQSLGAFGLVLWTALFAALIWWLVDLGILLADSVSTMTWISLVCVSLLLAIGMSWSHIRRRLTGQVDVDEGEHH
jgi:hypothetical protein